MTDFSESQKAYMNALFGKISDNFNKKTEEINTSLKAEIVEVREAIHQLGESYENKIKLLETENQQLRETVSFLQKKVRKNNIILFGIEGSDRKLWESVIHLIRDTLEIDIAEGDFNDIYKIGNNNNNNPVVVELISYQKKILILKNAHKLKGKNIYVSQDLSPEDRANHKVLVRHMQEAKNKGLKSYIKGQKLVIEEDTYTLKQLENRGTSSLEKLYQQNAEETESEAIGESNSASSTPDPQRRQKRLLKELGVDEELEQDNKKPKSNISNKLVKPGKPSAIKTRSITASTT